MPEIKMHVEDFCKKKGVQEITPDVLFNSKPDIRKVYTNPISFAYEPHLGPVYSLSFSPFQR